MFDTCPAHLRRVSALGLFESYTVELMKLEDLPWKLPLQNVSVFQIF